MLKHTVSQLDQDSCSVNNPFTKKISSSLIAAVLLPLPLAVSSAVAQAQNAPANQPQAVEELLIVGSRTRGRVAEDLPVPVDVLDTEAIEKTGQRSEERRVG